MRNKLYLVLITATPSCIMLLIAMFCFTEVSFPAVAFAALDKTKDAEATHIQATLGLTVSTELTAASIETSGILPSRAEFSIRILPISETLEFSIFEGAPILDIPIGETHILTVTFDEYVSSQQISGSLAYAIGVLSNDDHDDYRVLFYPETISQSESITYLGTVNVNSNLRIGPGTNYEVVGLAKQGQAVTIVDKNEDSTWYYLDSDVWIAASLVTTQSITLSQSESPPFSLVDWQEIDTSIMGNVTNTTIDHKKIRKILTYPSEDGLDAMINVRDQWICAYSDCRLSTNINRETLVGSEEKYQIESLLIKENNNIWKLYLFTIHESVPHFEIFEPIDVSVGVLDVVPGVCFSPLDQYSKLQSLGGIHSLAGLPSFDHCLIFDKIVEEFSDPNSQGGAYLRANDYYYGAPLYECDIQTKECVAFRWVPFLTNPNRSQDKFFVAYEFPNMSTKPSADQRPGYSECDRMYRECISVPEVRIELNPVSTPVSVQEEREYQGFSSQRIVFDSDYSSVEISYVIAQWYPINGKESDPHWLLIVPHSNTKTYQNWKLTSQEGGVPYQNNGNSYTRTIEYHLDDTIFLSDTAFLNYYALQNALKVWSVANDNVRIEPYLLIPKPEISQFREEVEGQRNIQALYIAPDSLVIDYATTPGKVSYAVGCVNETGCRQYFRFECVGGSGRGLYGDVYPVTVKKYDGTVIHTNCSTSEGLCDTPRLCGGGRDAAVNVCCSQPCIDNPNSPACRRARCINNSCQ